jgi:alpha-D-ribose 1-methylphosphonate 5-triphosphate diphosphatase
MNVPWRERHGFVTGQGRTGQGRGEDDAAAMAIVIKPRPSGGIAGAFVPQPCTKAVMTYEPPLAFTRPLHIEGAMAVFPDGVRRADLTVCEGLIAAIDAPAPADGERIDARGLLLAPAFVDIHGDGFERQIMPRPGVMIPIAAAMLETDRQLACNGIATACHALTLSWEPGLRSVATGEAVSAALAEQAPRLTVDNWLQLRWETFCSEALPLIARALAAPRPPAIAFNDHTTMALLHPGTALQDRPFDHDPAYPLADTTSAAFFAKMAPRAARALMQPDAYIARLMEVWQRRDGVPDMIAQVAAMGRAAGVPMLSHDDSRPETRVWFRGHGARISEFPMTLATARAARAAGDRIVFGAPNAARGGSHLGSPGARDMIAAGLCDILASDYHYPALLAAVARLHADGAGGLARLWPLVSTNPAQALGLNDRGWIAIGLRADLLLVDWPGLTAGGVGPPAVRLTLSGGRTAYRALQ